MTESNLNKRESLLTIELVGKQRVGTRRLTHPPAQVSGRVSLRPAEGAGCGCFRSTDGGRKSHPPRLR